MSTLPGTAVRTETSRAILLSEVGAKKHSDVTIDSGQSDSGSTPTSRIREGRVVVLRTSTGRYVFADDANGDRCTPPVVTAAEAADGDWASTTITLKRNGATVVTVTLGAGDNTTNLVVTALNANAAFRANAIASASSGRVVVTGLVGGAGESIEIVASLATAFGTAGTASDSGEDADYAVTTQATTLLDPLGVAAHALAPALAAGNFDESELLSLTGEAKVVLSRRGSIFG